jgi:hypothetical protein
MKVLNGMVRMCSLENTEQGQLLLDSALGTLAYSILLSCSTASARGFFL